MTHCRRTLHFLSATLFAAFSWSAAADETRPPFVPPVPEFTHDHSRQHSPAPISSSCCECESHAMSFGFAIGQMLTPIRGGASCAATIGIPLHPQCNDCTSFIGTPLHPHAFAGRHRTEHRDPGCSTCQSQSFAVTPCARTRVVEQYRNGQLTLVAFPAE